jgi:hypothetical protein
VIEIRLEKLQALGASTHDHFVTRAADFLAVHFPERRRRTREWRPAVESLVSEGEAIGLVTERNLAAFAALRLWCGWSEAATEAPLWFCEIAASAATPEHRLFLLRHETSRQYPEGPVR